MRTGIQLTLFLAAATVLLTAPAAIAITMPAGGVSLDVLAAEPAVEAPPEAVEDEEPPWTSRFLAPAVLAIGVVAIGGTALYYALRIRGRYRVVQ